MCKRMWRLTHTRVVQCTCSHVYGSKNLLQGIEYDILHTAKDRRLGHCDLLGTALLSQRDRQVVILGA